MSSRVFEVLDPEEERLRSRRRGVLFFASLMSLGIFSYPHIRNYDAKWASLTAARKMGLYIQYLKTKAILDKKSVEIRFVGNKTIEIYEVGSCGLNATRTKVAEKPLNEFAEGVEFLSAGWVHENADANATVLTRFCYDPLFGSSISADGLFQGAVFLAHADEPRYYSPEAAVRIIFTGVNGDIELE